MTTYDIKTMIHNNLMTVADAKAAESHATESSITPGYKPLAHIFEVVSITTGAVLRSTWTFNRARQNLGPDQVIVYAPTMQVVDFNIAPVDHVTAVKKVARGGNSLRINMTRECEVLGVGPGDFVEITIKRV